MNKDEFQNGAKFETGHFDNIDLAETCKKHEKIRIIDTKIAI
jgi:hypothetical protein